MIKSWSSVRRWPRLGKIRIGVKAKTSTGKEYPKAVDYFVCPDEVIKVYGEKPKELFIMLPSNNPEEFFPQFFKKYGKSTGLVCKGDGVTAMRSNEKGEMSEIECQGEKCSDYDAKKCKEIAMLQFFIPDVPGIGVWQIDTSSFNSIVNINSMVDLLQMGNHGKLTGIPLVLRLVDRDAKVEGKKKKIKVLDIQVRTSLKELMNTPLVISKNKLLPSNVFTDEKDKQDEDLFLKEMQLETDRNTKGVEVPDIIKGNTDTGTEKDVDKETQAFVNIIKEAKKYLTENDILKVIGNCGYTTAEEVEPRHRKKVLEVLRDVYLEKKRTSKKNNSSLV